jgi:glutathione S-transferase
VVVQAQELDLIRVYRVPFSTNVERVALAAAHKGVAVDWVDVDADDRSPVEDVSGQPLVPVLVHGAEVVADSPRILDWLEARVPEPPLYPRDPALRAAATVFVEWFNLVWKRPPNELCVVDDPAERAALVARMHASVDVFEGLLDGRDYLLGEFGIADVVAFPFLKYAVFGLPEGDDELFHRILAEHLPLRAGSPLRAWAERVDERPRA